MPRPISLPPGLVGLPLTPDVLRAAKVSPKVLRGGRFSQRSRGLYLPEASEDPTLAWAGVLSLSPPGTVLSHVTALAGWGLPLPVGPVHDIHLTTERGVAPPHRQGVVGHCMELPGEHVTLHGGLPLTTPARTIFDIASCLTTAEVVGVCDAALRLGLTTEGELLDIGEWGGGRRGVRAFKKAVALKDARAESPPESSLRVWFALAGLPHFDPNAEVWDGEQFVARVDLLNHRHAVAVEYEGSYHRTRKQFADDISRRSRLTSLGLEVVQIEATMMRSPRAVVLHVSQVLRRRGWRGRPDTRLLVQ